MWTPEASHMARAAEKEVDFSSIGDVCTYLYSNYGRQPVLSCVCYVLVISCCILHYFNLFAICVTYLHDLSRSSVGRVLGSVW